MSSDSQPEATLSTPIPGPLAMSRDIFHCHNLGGGGGRGEDVTYI